MKKLAVLIIAIFILYVSHPFILDSLGRHLVVQDKLEKADVIIVLSGDWNGERVDQGVKLYKQGYAKYLLMSGGPLAWHLNYAQWMAKQAKESGVPGRAIILEEKSMSTFENAKFSLPLVRARGFHTAIIVTSPPHSRRAIRTFRKVFSPAGVKVISYPVQKSEINLDRWWTRHEDTGMVVWEYVSAVLYFFKGY